jgi:hypothetical protein
VRIEADVTATGLVVRLGPFRSRIDDAGLHRVLTPRRHGRGGGARREDRRVARAGGRDQGDGDGA